MLNNDRSKMVLLVQNSHNVFCYFNVSNVTVEEFKVKFGESFWKNSKPVLKVYVIENGNAKEEKSIFIDECANNWYIRLERDAVDVFVKLGRVLPDDSFVAIEVSNTVTTPRANQSGDNNVYYVDVSQNDNYLPENALPTYSGNCEKTNDHNEPKPNPFKDSKKKSLNKEVNNESIDFRNDFFSRHIENISQKFNVNSSNTK